MSDSHVVRLRCPTCHGLAGWIDRDDGRLVLRYMWRRHHVALGEVVQVPNEIRVLDPRRPAPTGGGPLARLREGRQIDGVAWPCPGPEAATPAWPCPRCPETLTTFGQHLAPALDDFDRTAKVQTLLACPVGPPPER